MATYSIAAKIFSGFDSHTTSVWVGTVRVIAYDEREARSKALLMIENQDEFVNQPKAFVEILSVEKL